MDAFLAWIVTAWGELTTAVGWMSDRTTEVAGYTTSANASQASAATSANNAASSAAASANYSIAAASAAVAAQAGAGIPAAASFGNKVLRVDNLTASWQWHKGVQVQIRGAAGAHNQLSSTTRMGVDLAFWGKGTEIASVFGLADGPNGIGYVYVNVNGPSATYIGQTYTPVNGQTKTFAVWWRGVTKPGSGDLMGMNYRDAGGVLRQLNLPFSDPSVIADGKWRRYAVTTTHANANTSGCSCYILNGAPAGAYNFADPSLVNGALPGEYVAADTAIGIDRGATVHVDTSLGGITFYPWYDPSPGDWFGVVDSGRVSGTTPFAIHPNGKLIMGLPEIMDCAINGASFELVYEFQKGWVLR